VYKRQSLYSASEKGHEKCVWGRFPFHRYHADQWSLEHIHPQAPTSFQGSYAEAEEWLTTIEGALKQMIQAEKAREWEKIQDLENLLQKVRDLKGKAEKAKKAKKSEKGQFREFMETLRCVAQKVFQQFGAGDVDDISNIALLPRGLNSKLSNLPFPVKRKKLLEEEEAGAFVPPRTRDAFLKAFEDAPKDFLVWGPESRKAYEDHIVKTLEAFLNAVEKFSASKDCGKE
jgi:ribosomal protein S25